MEGRSTEQSLRARYGAESRLQSHTGSDQPAQLTVYPDNADYAGTGLVFRHDGKPFSGYTSGMARPIGTGKPPDERYITRAVKWPPELWKEVEERIPERERSAFVRQAVKDALLRRAAERLQHYYATDPEAVEWAEFAGDSLDE
jgi:hypothetical protein